MRIKQSLKMDMHNFRAIAVIVSAIYIVYTAIDIIIALTVNPVSGSYKQTIGLDLSIMTAMFLYGFMYFRRDFNMHMQNSVSRRTLFVSKIISAFICSALFALLNFIFTYFVSLICKLIIPHSNLTVEWRPIFTELYYYMDFSNVYFFGQANNFERIILGCILMFFASVFLCVLGAFVGNLFYRVNTVAKILIIVIPISLDSFFLPVIDSLATNGIISDSVNGFISLIFGVADKEAWKGILCFAVLTIASAAAFWITLRKTEVRK